jgi:hypothetical protein
MTSANRDPASTDARNAFRARSLRGNLRAGESMVTEDQNHLLLGAVEKVGKSSVQTLFFTLLLLPIVPQGSYLVTKYPDGKKVLELETQRRSVLAAYLRWWPGILGVLGIGGAVTANFTGVPDLVIPLGALGGALFLASLVAAVTTRGVLPPDEVARRTVYSEFVGVAVDVAQIKDVWSLRDDLKRMLSNLAESAGFTHGQKHGYGFDRWMDVALHPQMNDPQFLRAALTVSRILVGHPQSDEERATMPRVHDDIWRKLLATAGPAPQGARAA